MLRANIFSNIKAILVRKARSEHVMEDFYYSIFLLSLVLIQLYSEKETIKLRVLQIVSLNMRILAVGGNQVDSINRLGHCDNGGILMMMMMMMFTMHGLTIIKTCNNDYVSVDDDKAASDEDNHVGGGVCDDC